MKQFLIKSLLMRSWWVIAFILFCTILYERGLHKRDAQFQQLNAQLAALLIEKEQVLAKQEVLQRHVNSQSDLAWIELTLMKGLGVCPEDYQKVYFEEN